MYKVHVGYDSLGRNRWYLFKSLKAASDYCEAVRAATGIILAIEKD